MGCSWVWPCWAPETQPGASWLSSPWPLSFSVSPHLLQDLSSSQSCFSPDSLLLSVPNAFFCFSTKTFAPILSISRAGKLQGFHYPEFCLE